MRFRVTTLGKSNALWQLAEQHVNDLWIPAHLDDYQAEHFAIEPLQKWIANEAKLVTVETAGSSMG